MTRVDVTVVLDGDLERVSDEQVGQALTSLLEGSSLSFHRTRFRDLHASVVIDEVEKVVVHRE